MLLRIGSKRFLSQATAFDVVIGVMFGSILSRAINGSAPFLPTIMAGAALVGLHWVFAVLAFNTSIGSLVKERPRLLIEDGQLQRGALRQVTILPLTSNRPCASRAMWIHRRSGARIWSAMAA